LKKELALLAALSAFLSILFIDLNYLVSVKMVV